MSTNKPNEVNKVMPKGEIKLDFLDKNNFTDKQFAALMHYAKHRERSNAFRHAYKHDTLNASQVAANARNLFNRPKMKEAVAEIERKALEMLNEESASDAIIGAAWVLERAARLADFNLSKFIKLDENKQAYYDFSEATDDDWYCISEYTSDQITKGSNDDKYYVDRVKIKSYCKLKALELVGRHVSVQAFKDKVEHEHMMVVFEDDYSGND